MLQWMGLHGYILLKEEKEPQEKISIELQCKQPSHCFWLCWCCSLDTSDKTLKQISEKSNDSICEDT